MKVNWPWKCKSKPNIEVAGFAMETVYLLQCNKCDCKFEYNDTHKHCPFCNKYYGEDAEEIQ